MWDSFLLFNNNTNSNLIRKNIRRGMHVGQKPSKGWLAFKGFVAFEAALFIGSFLCWRHVNRSQTFRLYLSDNYPSVLEGISLEGFSTFSLNHNEDFINSKAITQLAKH